MERAVCRTKCSVTRAVRNAGSSISGDSAAKIGADLRGLGQEGLNPVNPAAGDIEGGDQVLFEVTAVAGVGRVVQDEGGALRAGQNVLDVDVDTARRDRGGL